MNDSIMMNDLVGWDYLGTFYAHNGNLSYREIGEKHNVSGSRVGKALNKLPKRKFSQLPEIDNKLLPNNSNKQ